MSTQEEIEYIARLHKRIDELKTARIAELEARLADAVDVIQRGVALMTPEQVGQWSGVRAWLEQSGSNRVRELEAETTRLLLDIEYRKALTTQVIDQRDAALAVVRQLRDAMTYRTLIENFYSIDELHRFDNILAAAARILGETR